MLLFCFRKFIILYAFKFNSLFRNDCFSIFILYSVYNYSISLFISSNIYSHLSLLSLIILVKNLSIISVIFIFQQIYGFIDLL